MEHNQGNMASSKTTYDMLCCCRLAQLSEEFSNTPKTSDTQIISKSKKFRT